jgi:hypothetical protein
MLWCTDMPIWHVRESPGVGCAAGTGCEAPLGQLLSNHVVGPWLLLHGPMDLVVHSWPHVERCVSMTSALWQHYGRVC